MNKIERIADTVGKRLYPQALAVMCALSIVAASESVPIETQYAKLLDAEQLKALCHPMPEGTEASKKIDRLVNLSAIALLIAAKEVIKYEEAGNNACQ